MVVSKLPLGIDVSSYQKIIDWDAVKAGGIQFGFTKATESIDYTNGTFGRNWREMKRVGIPRGAYHYSRPSRNSNPTQEVYYFLDAIDRFGGLEAGDIVIFDIEDPDYDGDLNSWALFQLQIAQNIIGFPPVLYTGPWYLDSRFPNILSEFANNPLWLASYSQTFPTPPKPWDIVSFWQFTDKGTVSGIAGSNNVDLNYFNGAAFRIPLLGKPGTIVEPEPPKVNKEEAYRVQLEKTREELTTAYNDLYKATTEIEKVHRQLNELSEEITKVIS